MSSGSEEFTVYCLASGSSANALLIVAGQDALLVDAGLGVRALKRELEARGVGMEQLKGVLLTHEHCDHVKGAIPLARKYNVPLVSTSGTLETLFAQNGRDAPHEAVSATGEIALGSCGVRLAPASHDASDPVGFRIQWRDVGVAYTTDTGAITPHFREICRNASLIAIESNHDIHKLRYGPYPDSLKARILGSRGHLSNNAACDLLLEHIESCGPVCAWLSHLSETNNTPRMALNYWKKRFQEAGHRASPACVEVALRDVPSLVYRTRSRSVQLALF